MAPHLSLEERRIVAGLLHRKVSVTQIAIQLGRHRSTIHREIRRNFWHDPEVPMATGYWHMNAQHMAAARRSRQRKLIRHDDLRLAVIERRTAGRRNRSLDACATKVIASGSATRRSTATSIRKTDRPKSSLATFPSADANGRPAMPASHEASSFQSVA